MTNTNTLIRARRDLPSGALLSALLSAHFKRELLTVTPRDAWLQVDRLAAGARREAAQATLAGLIADGLPVCNASAIVTDALKHRWPASKLRQLGATMRALVEHGLPCDEVAKIAERVINSSLNDRSINRMFALYLRQSSRKTRHCEKKPASAVSQAAPRID